jgi:phenylacetate-CoA ligase
MREKKVSAIDCWKAAHDKETGRMNWNTVLRVACWASGHSRYKFDQLLQANERLRPEEIAKIQWEKLQNLVAHAYATVPYYRELFRKEKIMPQDIQTLRDYAALPILTKAIIRGHGPEAFRSTAFPPSSLADTATSGSTGEPLHFFREHEYEEWRMAGSWRAWRWGGWTPGEKMAWVWREYWSSDRKTRFLKQISFWITRRRLYNVFEMSDATMDRWIHDLHAYQPKFMFGFPSALAHVAKHLAIKGTELPGVKTIFTNGEMLQSEQREIIEKVFQCKVHNMYGSAEVHPIAAECRLGALHLSTDLTIAELGDEPGLSGMRKVVLTPLHAFGMTLLRYEIGDLAEAIVTDCPCGLPFPALQGLVGRTADLFPLPDNRVVHGQILIAYLSGLKHIERFQFRQRTANLLTLAIVRTQGFDSQSEHSLQTVMEKMSRELGIPVRLEYVENIPLTAGGKFRYTVCEVTN